MKTLFSLLAIVMLNTDCDQNKSDANKTAINSENSTKQMQDNIKISYETTTRGFYEKFWIDKDSLTITNDRDHVEKTSYSTPEKEWNELLDILKKVDVSALPNLEAPTSLRHHDGARFATLMVKHKGIESESESFDHGNPPKSIEALVNKVLSIKEMTIKP